MFRYNQQNTNHTVIKFIFQTTTPLLFFILALACLSTHQALAEESSTTTTVVKMKSQRSIGLSYLSWTETLDLDNGSITDKAFANFYGNSLFYEKTFPTSQQNGYSIELGALAGQANGGGTQSLITYQKSYTKWWGAESTLRLAHQLSQQIVLSAGAMILYRKLTWPDQTSALNVKSGADINVAALLDIKMNLGEQLFLKNTLGTMAFKASTYWALCLGYDF